VLENDAGKRAPDVSGGAELNAPAVAMRHFDSVFVLPRRASFDVATALVHLLARRAEHLLLDSMYARGHRASNPTFATRAKNW
jgi:hypothetical protein